LLQNFVTVFQQYFQVMLFVIEMVIIPYTIYIKTSVRFLAYLQRKLFQPPTPHPTSREKV